MRHPRLVQQPRRRRVAVGGLVVLLVLGVALVVVAGNLFNVRSSLSHFTSHNAPPPPPPASSVHQPLLHVPLPVERIDLTFYATMRELGHPQQAAIRSWLALGADVIVFIDSPTGQEREAVYTGLADGSSGQPQERFRVLPTPLPRGVLGAPRLDLVMESGESYAQRTNWVCMINADIILPSSFGQLITVPFRDLDIMAVGERLDCRVNPKLGGGDGNNGGRLPESVTSMRDLERYSMAPCWPHGPGGKDFFLYRRGLFQRHQLTVPPFWVGKYIWDHWLVNSTREFAVDVTPSLLVGHVSHEYDWNWRNVGNRRQAEVKKQLAEVDIEANRRAVQCEGDVWQCVPFQSTYNTKYQLCPGHVIQPMPKNSRTLYFASMDRVRGEMKKPGAEGKQMRRVYETLALNGSSPPYWDGHEEHMATWASEHGCKI